MKQWIGVVALCAALAAAPACSKADDEANAAAAQPVRAAQAAGGVTDPVAFIKSVYQANAADDGPAVESVYSARLRALWADEEKDAGGEVGRIEFNFWTNAQDDDVKTAEVTSEAVGGREDRRVVTAKFVNIGRPSTILYYFERTNGRWYLDDARNVGGKGKDDWPWTLSLILKYGM